MSEVLTEDASYKMLHMLKSVIDGGTGGRVRFRYGIKAEMGGKTGTTQNNSDGWFMGFTPSLVSGCWVGGEDRSIHFDRLAEERVWRYRFTPFICKRFIKIKR